jgi:hypothetical protein
MSAEGWIALVAIVITVTGTVVGAAVWLSIRITKLSENVLTIKKEVETMAAFWNKRECERHAAQLNGLVARVLKIENEKD